MARLSVISDRDRKKPLCLTFVASAGVCLTSLLKRSSEGFFAVLVTYYAQSGHRFLPDAKKGLLATFPNAGSFIPWRVVEKNEQQAQGRLKG